MRLWESFQESITHLIRPVQTQGVGACRIGRKRDKSERSSPRGEWGGITLGNEVFRVPSASKLMNPKTEIYFCEGWYRGCTAKRWGRNVQFEESYPFLRVSVREKTSLSQINWQNTIRVIWYNTFSSITCIFNECTLFPSCGSSRMIKNAFYRFSHWKQNESRSSVCESP